MSRCSFAKAFLTLLWREVRAQILIQDRDSCTFQPATVLSNISSFLCLKLLYFLLCFINCEDAATAQRVAIFFLSVFLLLPIHTLHFTLFTSTLLIISFEVLFLNLYLGTLSYKKKKKIYIYIYKNIFIENHEKTWEIVMLTNRCIIKKRLAKKVECKCSFSCVFSNRFKLNLRNSSVGLLILCVIISFRALTGFIGYYS